MARKSISSKKATKAYMTFEKVIERSFDLLALEKVLEVEQQSDAQAMDVSDLTRAAIVLGVAAMDAYFTDVFAELLVPFLKERGVNETLEKVLFKAGLNTRAALELIAMRRPYRRIRRLIEDHHERRTTQKTKMIDDLFLSYDLPDFCLRIEHATGRKQLLRSIELLVERRHAIAHEGDLNSHGKLKAIDRELVRKRLRDVVLFVAGSERLLASQLPWPKRSSSRATK